MVTECLRPAPDFNLINKDLSLSPRRRAGIENFLTDSARDLLTEARQMANDTGSESVDGEHFLRAMISQKDSVGRMVLVAGGIDPFKVDEAMQYIVLMHTDQTNVRPLNVDLELSSSMQDCMDIAVEESRQMGTRHVGTHHVLLALSRQKGELAQEMLESLGFDPQRLQGSVQDIVASFPRSSLA